MFYVFIVAVIVFIASYIMFELVCYFWLHTWAYRLLMPLRWILQLALLVIVLSAVYGSTKIFW